MISSKCQYCGKDMMIPHYKPKHGQGKFCSRSCRSKIAVLKTHALRTPKWTEDFKKRAAEWHERMRIDPTLCYQWKGDEASYRSKHSWITNHFGRPKRCESCGLSDSSRMHHWANISGKHLRNRSDYKRMCVPCHSRYDLSKNPKDKRRKRERVGA